jgi:hypothetical protein
MKFDTEVAPDVGSKKEPRPMTDEERFAKENEMMLRGVIQDELEEKELEMYKKYFRRLKRKRDLKKSYQSA